MTRILVHDRWLSAYLLQFDERLLILALSKITDDNYPIRNCASIIFATITSRVFKISVCIKILISLSIAE